MRAAAGTHLAYAGGVALNSVANNRIVNEIGFEDVFIMPAAEDSGTSIGAAYYGLWQLCGYSRRERQRLDNPGGAYAESEITTALGQFPMLRSAKTATTVTDAAGLLAQGKIVGWYQGGAELGPRALGQRSILCDPRPGEMKDVLNSRVKFREGFRPFAPMIPEEEVHDWFEIDPSHRTSPFMLRVMPFRPEQAERVPAVVHVDGTGRVQTVNRDVSPQLHGLLTAFKAETGVPVLLNTSFNIAGEPIVETPADAMWCFLYTDMDYCIMGDYLLSKDRSLDCVLNTPLRVMARTSFTFGDLPVNGNHGAAVHDLPAAVDYAVSGHLSRAEQLPDARREFPWLQLVVVVTSPWGRVVHGLTASVMHILRLIDGRATGMEIYERLVAEGASSQQDYAVSRFRRHIGLLKRIGAIGFTQQGA
jgi:carbamoyltransferase